MLLEPVEVEERKPWKTLEELYARFSSEETDPIFPDGREQPEMQERDRAASSGLVPQAIRFDL